MGRGGETLPLGHIGMCHCEEEGFQKLLFWDRVWKSESFGQSQRHLLKSLEGFERVCKGFQAP